ncbi:MAG: NAD(P)-dependent alcohol dehydrogenase [Anaerolineae bacterium]|jgi:D-xylulose reductase
MRALVLERAGELSLREIAIEERMGPRDVRIAVRAVGICGSDLHYYEHGAIGPYVVREPMVLGHEAAGTVVEVGAEVEGLKAGDRVCMEPGIPDPRSKAARLGMYNLDPGVRFWATPPVHGVLRPEVVHPADFTYKLPENVGYGEGAMVEPLAVGMHAAKKAAIAPGDVAVVIGAGTIGMMTVLSTLAGGCSQVIVSDVVQPKLDLAQTFGPVVPVNVREADLAAVVDEVTEGWGADVVFEASGNGKAAAGALDLVCPGGAVVFVGIPEGPIAYDVVAAQAVEARVEHVFRYANVYPRALALLGSGQIDVKPMITDVYPFEESIEAFEFAREMPPTSVKVQIVMKE